MKRLFYDEKWCLNCHLCEYACAFANSDLKSMTKLKGKKITPNVRVEGNNKCSYASSCRQCQDPVCVKSCISGALHIEDGVAVIDHEKCINCLTCVMVCPYGAVVTNEDYQVNKCELCTKNQSGTPACAKACPNRAIVFEER